MMQENERLEKQLDFIREIDKEKEIFRQTYLADASRKENDAEHAWHMAIMTMLLSEYANEKIDVLKTVGMLLIHDIVEIDAGDTYAYDEAGKATQHEREQKAADVQKLGLRRGDAEHFTEKFKRRFRLQLKVDAAALQGGEQVRFLAGLERTGRADGLAEKSAGLFKARVRRSDGIKPEAGIFVGEDQAHGEREIACVGGDGFGKRRVGREPVLRKLVRRFARKIAEKRRLRQQKDSGDGQNGDGGVLQVGNGRITHGSPPRRRAG